MGVDRRRVQSGRANGCSHGSAGCRVALERDTRAQAYASKDDWVRKKPHGHLWPAEFGDRFVAYGDATARNIDGGDQAHAFEAPTAQRGGGYAGVDAARPYRRGGWAAVVAVAGRQHPKSGGEEGYVERHHLIYLCLRINSRQLCIVFTRKWGRGAG